uniref:Uncharacterized protein n=1 Tax=Rhizophora mucronata TaxID=61149 RepID=A0A2P2NP55_RHIMU
MKHQPRKKSGGDGVMTSRHLISFVLRVLCRFKQENLFPETRLRESF